VVLRDLPPRGPLDRVLNGRLFDSGAHLLAPHAATISGFTALGELPLPLWLLIRGVGRLPGDDAPAET
jgi:hypothetical protein